MDMTTATRTASDIIVTDTTRRASDPDRHDLLTCTDAAYVAAIVDYVVYINSFAFTDASMTPGALATDVADRRETVPRMVMAHLDRITCRRIGSGYTFAVPAPGMMVAEVGDQGEMIDDIDLVAAYMT